jgi:hypothetical protein
MIPVIKAMKTGVISASSIAVAPESQLRMRLINVCI